MATFSFELFLVQRMEDIFSFSRNYDSGFKNSNKLFIIKQLSWSLANFILSQIVSSLIFIIRSFPFSTNPNMVWPLLKTFAQKIIKHDCFQKLMITKLLCRRRNINKYNIINIRINSSILFQTPYLTIICGKSIGAL